MSSVLPGELGSLGGATLLITGAGGMLGTAFQRVARTISGCRVIALDRQGLDVTDREAVARLAPLAPDVILHCAADVNADRCEQTPDACRAVQVGGTDHVIALARATGARVVYPQSVFIFDGTELPVSEITRPAPMSVYGRCKLEAERRLLDSLPDVLVVRMAGFFGGEQQDKNFVGSFTRAVFERGTEQRCFRIGERSWQPTYTMDLAANTLLLVALQRTGIYHMGAYGEATFYEVALACVEDLGLGGMVTVEKAGLDEIPSSEVAPRPLRMITANRRLAAEGLDRQRPWREALREYLHHPFFQDRARRATGLAR